MSCIVERAIFWNLVENLRCHCESQLKCWWWNYRCRLNRWLPLWPHSGGLYSAVPRLLLWWTCDFSAAVWSQRGKSSRQLTVLSSELFKQDNTCKKFYLIHCFISFCALWAEVAEWVPPHSLQDVSCGWLNLVIDPWEPSTSGTWSWLAINSFLMEEANSCIHVVVESKMRRLMPL